MIDINSEILVNNLFDEKVRTGSMTSAVHCALAHDIPGCGLCLKHAFSWSGTTSVCERVSLMKDVALKLNEIDTTASKILAVNIDIFKPVVMV
jgi:hypothetical protein